MKIASIGDYSKYYFGGYKISLDDGKEIVLSMDDSQQCCESYGYFLSEDDFSNFIGAEVLDVRVVDEQLKTTSTKSYEGEAIFVNIETDRGTLQFTAYNDHNGYYGHEVKIKVADKEETFGI